MTFTHRLTGFAVLITALAAAPAAAQTPVTFGTLDNFDVINDTGSETHGFEIELEGIVSSDVAYTFGNPYIRYGDPAIVATANGVIVRYAAAWDATSAAWSATTPLAVAPYLPSDGHSCWTGGVPDPAIYYAAGCDHFGVSLNAVPTKTTYRWLVAGSTAGTLVPFGTTVSMPAPTWNVTPPASPGAQPVVVAVMAAPEPDGMEFGDALWVKVFVTELPEPLDATDLQHMVIDDPDVDIVPNEPAETEWEWYLLQKSVSEPAEDEFGAGEVGAGNEAVSRRFEFYRYTGDYDPESHEARCNDPLDTDQHTAGQCGLPDVSGLAGVGDLIGTQNVAINLAGEFAAAPNRPPVASCMALSAITPESSCEVPASIDNGSYDPDADAIVLVQSPAGPYSLGTRSVTLTVTDSHDAAASCSAPVEVRDETPPNVTSVSPNPEILKAGGAKMVPVTVAVTATDGCDATVSCRITAVSSNEAISGLKHNDRSPDWQITGDLTLLLRGERDNKGTGRIYSITVSCQDASGNMATGTGSVSVPK